MEELLSVVLGLQDPSVGGFHPGYLIVPATLTEIRLGTQFPETALDSNISISFPYPRQIRFFQCHGEKISERAYLVSSSPRVSPLCGA